MESILDSGNRTKFSTGAVRDIQEDKGRCDLLPLEVIAKFAISDKAKNVLLLIDKFMKTGNTSYLVETVTTFCDLQGWTFTECVLEVSIHYKQGAEKYGERNWEKGIPLHSYMDSGVRHLLKYAGGWKDEPHDRAFVWNIFGAIWTLEHKPEMIDIPFDFLGGN